MCRKDRAPRCAVWPISHKRPLPWLITKVGSERSSSPDLLGISLAVRSPSIAAVVASAGTSAVRQFQEGRRPSSEGREESLVVKLRYKPTAGDESRLIRVGLVNSGAAAVSQASDDLQ